MAKTEAFGDALKKVMLAGVGAVAYTAEKSKGLLDDLVKKGEETIEHGKALNEELKHNRETKETEDFLDSLTAEQMEKLKEKILQREADAASGADAKSETESQAETEVEGESDGE